MFKTAAAKIAHNSTLPALGGNQDLRPLQDLITAEKTVLISLQKLSVDYSKASEALRTWGLNEGDDLGDILSASTTILNHFSSALSQYASHGHVMRDHLKAIRSREESLEDLKRRRRTVHKKAEDAEKKLSRMSPEHKNLAMQTETLNRLRDEIRVIDSDIMTEEAALGDFKRTATRMWIGLKFGGLLECCEKGTIVAEFGKMIVSEISEEATQPGLPRALYYGHSKTEQLVAEAHRCINDITLSTIPSVGFRDRRHYDGSLDVPDQTLPSIPQEMPPQTGFQLPGEEISLGPGPWSASESKPQPPPPGNSYDRPFGSDAPGSPATTTGGSFANHPQQQLPPQNQGGQQLQTMDDFGVNVNTRSDGLIDNSNTSGGRFATFPVKMRPSGSTGGYSLQDGPSPSPRHDQEQSLSASIAEALDVTRTQEALGATEGTQNHRMAPWGGRNANPWSSPAPAPAVSIGSSSLPPPPPGAALPDFSSPWSSLNRDGSIQAPGHTRGISQLSDNDDALLAYMTMAPVDEEERGGDELAKPMHGPPTLGAPTHEEEYHRISRHVRFGEVEDVSDEMEKRGSLEKERHAQAATNGDKGGNLPTEPVQILNEAEKGPGIGVDRISPSSGEKPRRVPPPTFNPEEDERALNAAAARGVTQELEALNANPPSLSDMGRTQQTEPTVDRGRLPTTGQYSDQPNNGRDTSPFLPPSAPFAARSVSPHPFAEFNANAPAQHGTQYSPGQPHPQPYQSSGLYGSPPNASPAQSYAQSYQGSPSYAQPTTIPEAPVPSASLPPRFQALQHSMESPIPPRFQAARSQSPGSPVHNQLPPRFQAGGSPKIPPAVGMPEPQDPGRIGSLKAAEGSTPYRTPSEYPTPRQLGATSAFSKSSTSLNASSPSVVTPAPGARTISAAAFKRPRNASTDNLGGSGEFMKKSLPSSPYPTRDRLASNVGGEGAAPATSSTTPAPARAVRPPSTIQQADADDDHFDYISAYVDNSNPSSPKQGEFANNVNQGQGLNGPGHADNGRVGGGYGQGRFATDLDEGGLR